MRGRTQGLDADGLSLQFCNAGYALPREQFEAADHHAGQQRHALAGIDRLHALRGVERPKVGLAARDFSDVRLIYRRFDIADIGKALSAQQLLGDVQGGNAEATLLKPNGRRFERSLRSFRPASADQAGGAGGRDAAQEGASSLHQCHRMPPRIHAPARV